METPPPCEQTDTGENIILTLVNLPGSSVGSALDSLTTSLTDLITLCLAMIVPGVNVISKKSIAVTMTSSSQKTWIGFHFKQNGANDTFHMMYSFANVLMHDLLKYFNYNQNCISRIQLVCTGALATTLFYRYC